jgi:hypothetical protein
MYAGKFTTLLLLACLLSSAEALCEPAALGQASDDYTGRLTEFLGWQTSPVDLSFLNARQKPAGGRGFVRIVNSRLAFEDGTPARFWRTNLTAHALFETPWRASNACFALMPA